MTNPLTTLVPEHQLMMTSVSRGNHTTENVAKCSCGTMFGWYERETAHARHVLDTVRTEAIADYNNAPTRSVLATELTFDDTLVGDNLGRSLVLEVRPSASIPGLLAVETEHGPLYLDPEETYLIIDESK